MNIFSFLLLPVLFAFVFFFLLAVNDYALAGDFLQKGRGHVFAYVHQAKYALRAAILRQVENAHIHGLLRREIGYGLAFKEDLARIRLHFAEDGPGHL